MKECARFASFCKTEKRKIYLKSIEYYLDWTKNALYISIDFPLHHGNGANVVVRFSCFRFLWPAIVLFIVQLYESIYSCLAVATPNFNAYQLRHIFCRYRLHIPIWLNIYWTFSYLSHLMLAHSHGYAICNLMCMDRNDSMTSNWTKFALCCEIIIRFIIRPQWF